MSKREDDAGLKCPHDHADEPCGNTTHCIPLYPTTGPLRTVVNVALEALAMLAAVNKTSPHWGVTNTASHSTQQYGADYRAVEE
jgi:hypothetical protein